MSAPALERATFTTSRMLDFFSEKELITQTGHEVREWPLVVVKELVDNALDHCEEAGIAPEVSIVVDADGITVADNGQGIPAGTVAGVLDYSVRVSSREAYVAPDRGSQGNALKTLVAMPFVLGRAEGRVTLTARGIRHEITVAVDPIRQAPDISHVQHPADVKTGTTVTVHWPHSASAILDDARPAIFQVVSGYEVLNPHLAISVQWGDMGAAGEATDPAWPKWKPSEPTSPHWYTAERLERLIAAYLTHPDHAGMSVREFVTTFRGLSGSAKGKLVLAETGMTRTNLAGLANGSFDSPAIARLLAAMKRHSQPVKPVKLGVIGRDHLSACIGSLDAVMESFAYKRVMGETEGRPWVVEAAFAWCPDLGYRSLQTGVNWSPGVANQFRYVGSRGESLDTLLERNRVDEDCVLILHAACPVVGYENRGKSAVVLPRGGALPAAIISAAETVTKKWAAQRKAEERHASAQLRRRQVMTRHRAPDMNEAAAMVMEEAYLKASGNGRFYANARQIMYAARPRVLEITDGKIWSHSSYFTQTLLPDYVRRHGLKGTWKIAYDARGHLVEPHRNRLSGVKTSVALGTLEVREYQAASPADPLAVASLSLDFPTSGPRHRYSTAVFIEKEGFDQQITESGLDGKYDVGFMSTKGVSNTASRELVDYLASQGTRILIVRDFDRAGFTIAGTLTTSSRRYRFGNQVDVIDAGLRLADVEEHGLESEPWREKVAQEKVAATLRRHGASEDEIGFLVRGASWTETWGERVELNAFTSEQFIDWLEAKLIRHGTGKVIPDGATLALQYRRALARHAINKKISEIGEQIRADAGHAAVPPSLAERVRELLAHDPGMSWDAAVARIAARGRDGAQ